MKKKRLSELKKGNAQRGRRIRNLEPALKTTAPFSACVSLAILH